MTGTNPVGGTRSFDFTVVVYDCAKQVLPKPHTGPDYTIFKGLSETYIFTWTQTATDADPRCHNLVTDFEIMQGDGSFLPIDPANLPTWVTSFTQTSGNAPFSYTVTF